MTGESIPVDKAPGDKVFAGTLNGAGVLEVRVTKRAGETTLSRIVRLVEDAQSEKAPSEAFTQWFGSRYTIAVLGFAMLAIVIPMALRSEAFDTAFYRAMTLLVVASPCAVVISIPAALMAAIAGAARGGVLFKGGAHLEELARVRAIAFDKTGTLTAGRPQLAAIQSVDGNDDEVLALAAAAEAQSEHPIAVAIIEAAKERGLEFSRAKAAQALVGRGLSARVDGREILIGKSDLWLNDGGVPSELLDEANRLSSAGNTVIFIGEPHKVLGLLAVADTLRPGAAASLHQLRDLNIENITMLTGDHEAVAQKIAGELDITYHAGLMPDEKLQIIKKLKQRYGSVAMIGDGINDAPSLAAADLGVSLGGTGTDVALETADVVLMSDDLHHLPYAIALARATKRIITQNLIFAFSMMGVLIASTFFASLRLPFAVMAHEGSTVLVILNGLRLLGFRFSTKSA
jgi:Cd2+/Zn2+-exporting ATPase